MRKKWFLLLVGLCMILTLYGCSIVPDGQVKTRYGVSFVSIHWFTPVPMLKTGTN